MVLGLKISPRSVMISLLLYASPFFLFYLSGLSVSLSNHTSNKDSAVSVSNGNNTYVTAGNYRQQPSGTVISFFFYNSLSHSLI